MKIYNVYHVYDVDGGYGDAVPAEAHVATFESETDAKAFVAKYNDPYVYDEPYNKLYCNEFVIREFNVVTHTEFDINQTPEDYGIWVPWRRSVKANDN